MKKKILIGSLLQILKTAVVWHTKLSKFVFKLCRCALFCNLLTEKQKKCLVQDRKDQNQKLHV